MTRGRLSGESPDTISGSSRSESDTNSRSSRSRSPDVTTQGGLHEAALRYLDRYDTSTAHLRRLLIDKIRRKAPERVDELRPSVDHVLERLTEARLLDDARYASTLARGLRERGTSAARIRMKLRSRGLPETLVDEALEEADRHASEDPELVAATAYARKRRLQSRFDLEDPKQRQKALASLARQGFSFDVARRVLAS